VLIRTPAVLGAGVFVLLVAFSPQLGAPAFTARAVVLVIVAVVGLAPLSRLAWRRDLAALAALSFVTWAAVATVAAGTPLAWTGRYNLGTGWVFVVAVASAWAIGRELPADARRSLEIGLLAGVALNVAVAVLQLWWAPDAAQLSLIDGRSTGLLGNAVFLGAVSAIGATVAAGSTWLGIVPAGIITAGLASGTQLSGSRAALGMLLFAVAAGWITRRQTAARAVITAAVLAGVIAGSVLQTLSATDATAATDRLAQTTTAGSFTQRLETWEAGIEAGLDHPVFGVGPGRFLAASSPRRSLDLARAAGPDAIFSDAHNLVIEHLATTGVPGVLALAVWLWIAGRGAWRGDRALALAAAAGGAFHLLEPQNLVVTPLTALALGVASKRHPPVAVGSRPSRSVRGAAPGATVVGIALVVGSRLLVGDYAARQAVLDFDAPKASSASDLLWPWAEPLALEARIAVFDALLSDALELSEQAIDREPEEPALWGLNAGILTQLGRFDDAADAFAEVLARNPWSLQGLRGRAESLDAVGRFEAADACRELIDLVRSQTRDGSGRSRSRLICLEG